MSSSTNPGDSTPQNGGLAPLAYLFIAIGGGVVGRDYAVGANLDPMTGLILGVVISAILTGILNYIRTNKDGISEGLAGIGLVGGLIIGANMYFSEANPADGSWVVIPILGFVGALIGQVVAACIVFIAAAAFVLSQGPIGYFFRETLLQILHG